jgi:anti-anti-sigma factor
MSVLLGEVAMEIKVTTQDEVSVLKFSGKMTIDVGDVMLRETFEELSNAGTRFFVFDLRELFTLDSAGLGEIIACHKLARESGGGVRIVLEEPRRIGEFFSAAHLNRVFELFADEHSAVMGFGTEPTVG